MQPSREGAGLPAEVVAFLCLLSWGLRGAEEQARMSGAVMAGGGSLKCCCVWWLRKGSVASQSTVEEGEER